MQPLPSGAAKIVEHGFYGRYMNGYLLFIRDGRLLAEPFDLERLEATGLPVPAIDSVMSSQVTGGAQFAVSAGDRLVYLPASGTTGVPIYWMDRAGTWTVLRGPTPSWYDPQFSPDGRRLALEILDPPRKSVWVYEWTRDTLTRLTVSQASDYKPVWTPDGRRIAFASTRGNTSTSNLYWQRADGISDAQRLTESPHAQLPASWHPSGRFLAFEEQISSTNSNVLVVPVEGNEANGWTAGKPTALLDSPFDERAPMISPDGRWLAYSSNESGQPEVWVQSFQGPGRKWQISTGGGVYPTWSRTRSELVYATAAQQIMVASYALEGDAFHADKPRLWSEKQGKFSLRGGERSFDLHPDGERLAMGPDTRAALGATQEPVTHVTLIFNLPDHLRQNSNVK